MKPDSRVEGELAVVEEETAFLVLRAGDSGDWLARFEKSPGFPAREWADNMAAVYNRRLRNGVAGPSTPPGQRPATYHPE